MSMKMSLVLVVLLWTSTGAANVKSVECDDESWSMSEAENELKPVCFKVMNKDTAATYYESEELCETIGAVAAPFRSLSEKKAIEDNLKKQSITPDNFFSSLFIGLHDVAYSFNESARYKWTIDGHSLTNFTHWRTEEPTREAFTEAKFERCVVIMLSEDLLWLDITCEPKLQVAGGWASNVKGIVCAKPAKAKKPACQDDSWSISIDENELDPVCFKVINKDTAATYYESEELCETIGAVAAPFRSLSEKKAIEDNLKKQSITPDNFFSSLFIGLHDVAYSFNESARYKWTIDGHSLTNFTHWRTEEPTREAFTEAKFERCVVIMLSEDLLWLDITCEPKLQVAGGWASNVKGIVCAKPPGFY